MRSWLLLFHIIKKVKLFTVLTVLYSLPVERQLHQLYHFSTASPLPVDNLGTDSTTPPFPIRRPEVTVENMTEPIKGVRKVMSKTMTTSLSIPHFCYMDEINLDELVR